MFNAIFVLERILQDEDENNRWRAFESAELVAVVEAEAKAVAACEVVEGPGEAL
jgi:hypothetical protein